MGISWSEKTRKEYRMALPADGKQMDQFQTMVENAAQGLAPKRDREFDNFYHYDVEKTEGGYTLLIWFYITHPVAVRTEESNKPLPWMDNGPLETDGHP